MMTTFLTAVLAYAVWVFKMKRAMAYAPVRIRRK